jgi:hypothetical protein
MASDPEWLQPVLQEIQGTLRRMEQRLMEIQEDCLDVFAFGSFSVVEFCAKIFLTL